MHGSNLYPMKEPLKTLLRIAGVVVGLGAAAWALRDRLLPPPVAPEGPAPAFRTPPTPDDLTKVKGIGPVYAERLAAAGMSTFKSMIAAGAEAVGDAAGVSKQTADKWVTSAKTLG